MSTYSELVLVRDEIRQIPGIERKPPGGMASFAAKLPFALRLAFREKEIFVFALLQWVAIAIAYLLWVQILPWIPEETLQRSAYSSGFSMADAVVLVWSIACVGLAAFPVGIFSGCIGAAHSLHKQGKESTIAGCLALVLPRSGTLWAFHWIDGWITVYQIFDRLPRKNKVPGERAASEALYYAWKLGVSGVLPAIVAGSTLVDAARNSLRFVKSNFLQIAALRAGYSALCWLIGIAAYIGGFMFVTAMEVAPATTSTADRVYSTYLWAAGPILVAVAIVVLFLRPIYVLALCELYSDHVKSQRLAFKPQPTLEDKAAR